MIDRDLAILYGVTTGNLNKAMKRNEDRFMILDEITCYHIGSSIKDAGNKSFAISKIEDKQNISNILSRL